MSEPQALELYVAFGQRRGADPLHWILMLLPPGNPYCTWYHVTGGPTQGLQYTLQIQANKRVDSFGIASKTRIGTIPATEVNKVKAAAQAVPLQRCQRWTVAVLGRLEQKGLVPPETRDRFNARVEPSREEQAQASAAVGHSCGAGAGGSGSQVSGGSASG